MKSDHNSLSKGDRDKSPDSIAFADQSLGVFALNLGILPEIGKWFYWGKRTLKLSERVTYITGGAPDWVSASHDETGPLLSPSASVDSARREVRRCLDDAEREFSRSGFCCFIFNRGDIHLFDHDGNRTNSKAKADPRATVYIPTEYQLTPEYIDCLQNVRACAREIDIFRFDLRGRNKALRDIVEAYFSSRVDSEGKRRYFRITPDKSPKSKGKEKKADAEPGGITVMRTMHELQQMPRPDQVEFVKGFIEASTSHLITDSQDYAEGAHIFSKAQTAVVIAKHSLNDLQHRCAKNNANGRPVDGIKATSRAAEARALYDEAGALLAKCEELASRADLYDLRDQSDYFRRWAASLHDFRWASNAERKAKSATEGGNQ